MTEKQHKGITKEAVEFARKHPTLALSGPKLMTGFILLNRELDRAQPPEQMLLEVRRIVSEILDAFRDEE
jgi:hypothetical protein